ncbi:aldehyde dehydrogenase [Niveomyces insectorum RCEF 264]|uniref:aldehyde dehydrogenase (NAD(+)) n=1 Tax=Niveomyces insectorum RCEF 264 TaxID=1081102 RepID=A0A167RX73_9HYPO|nr:aldehyde dehydrogenase [Niveomyces insectorum RCEF 264]
MGSNKTSPACLNFDTFYNVIGGALAKTAETISSPNPSTLVDNPPCPLSTAEDVDRAVESARLAALLWRQKPWSERQAALVAFADALETLADDFVEMNVKEQGKPLWMGRHEFAEAIKFLRGASVLTLPDMDVETTKAPYRKVFTRYLPLGVAVGIVPWNFPVFLAVSKLGPAVLAGNAFILKPSPSTPYTGLKLAELAQRFFPPGVVQALSGDESLGPLLTTHRGVDKVSFTGSTATGKRVMASCSGTLKRVTLELGGNDAAIVCADVDPAVVGPKVAMLALANSGQICVAVKRVFVHDSIYADVLASMVAFVKTLPVGDGLDQNVMLGPVTNGLQSDRVKDLLADIETEQHTIAVGGPVFPVLGWSDEAEVIRRVNDTDMGLGASIWTKDISRAERMSRQLMVGNVWINTHAELQANASFGGHKHSGLGVAFGVDGLKAYCNAQTVYVTHLDK